jgi:hypothetical protein
LTEIVSLRMKKSKQSGVGFFFPLPSFYLHFSHPILLAAHLVVLGVDEATHPLGGRAARLALVERHLAALVIARRRSSRKRRYDHTDARIAHKRAAHPS